jgi:hypothetical protein
LPIFTKNPKRSELVPSGLLYGLGIAMSLVGFVNTAIFPMLIIALLLSRCGSRFAARLFDCLKIRPNP